MSQDSTLTPPKKTRKQIPKNLKPLTRTNAPKLVRLEQNDLDLTVFTSGDHTRVGVACSDESLSVGHLVDSVDPGVNKAWGVVPIGSFALEADTELGAFAAERSGSLEPDRIPV